MSLIIHVVLLHMLQSKSLHTKQIIAKTRKQEGY